MTDDSYRDDYQALLEMARDKSADGRARLANATSDLFSQSNDVLTDHERALRSDILRGLLHDAEMSVRRKLSNKLAAMDDVPQFIGPDFIRGRMTGSSWPLGLP